MAVLTQNAICDFYKKYENSPDADLINVINEQLNRQNEIYSAQFSDFEKERDDFNEKFKELAVLRKDIDDLFHELYLDNDSFDTYERFSKKTQSLLYFLDEIQQEKKTLNTREKDLKLFYNQYSGFNVENFVGKAAGYIQKQIEKVVTKATSDYYETISDVLEFCLIMGPTVAQKYADFDGMAIVALLLLVARRKWVDWREYPNQRF